MKTQILAFLSALFIFGGSLHAAPISSSQALDIAQKIFSAQSTRKSSAPKLKIVWDGEEVATKADQPAFYVVARDGGGFVIVAGDDNVPPVLAISEANDFTVEDMPENVRWWMERMKAYVRSTTSQSPEVRDQWAKFTGTKAGAAITGTVENKVEHLTPEWGQNVTYHRGKPDERKIFNSKCPMVGDTAYTLTGCVATAIGEVMTTLSGLYPSDIMPTHSSGVIAPYSVSSGYVSASTEDHPYVLGKEYKWDDLRKLTGKAAIISALADGNAAWVDNMDQLLADVGAMMHSYYSPGGTSAYTSQTPDTIAKYYHGFNKAAYFAEASHYTGPQWSAKLKEQLKDRPIIYNGRTEDNQSGHAFVFDGYGQYDGTDVFHVNFGWTGYCNGYYYETNLDSDGDPGFNFSWKCGAVFDFYPVSDPDNPQYPIRLETYYRNETYPGIRFVQETEGYAIYYAISNKGASAYDGKLKFVVKSKDGSTESTIVTESFSMNAASNNYGKLSGYSVGPVSFGDKVICYYKEDASKEDTDPSAWKQLSGPPASTIVEWPLTPAAFIKTNADYSINDWLEFALMNNDYIYTGTTWTITGPDGETTKAQADRGFQFKQAGTYKIQAATARTVGGAVVENIVTYINVSE